MSTNIFTPAVPYKANDLLLTEGIVYKDLGEAGEAIIGATRGGSKLIIDWQKRIMPYDGAMGATKGMRRTEKFYAKLIIMFLKINYVNLAYGLNVTVGDGSDQDGTYKKISFDTDFASGDVLDNVAFLGYKADGKYCKIILENALNTGNIEIEHKEKDELVGEMTFEGFFTYSAPTTAPIKIQEEV